METFKIEKWDENTIGDVACEQLFKKPSTIVRKAIEKSKNKKKLKNKSKKLKKVLATAPIAEKSEDLLINKKKKDWEKTQKNVVTKKAHTLKPSNESFRKDKKEALIEHTKNVNKRSQKNKSNKSISTAESALGFENSSSSTHTENVVNRKSKRKKARAENASVESPQIVSKPIELAKQPKRKSFKETKQDKVIEKLKGTFFKTVPSSAKKSNNGRSGPLRERMLKRLKAARFRYLNEEIYSTDSKAAQTIFKGDPSAFDAYHDGYRQQVKSWPLNPLDRIIDYIKKLPKTLVVADFGCGEAKLAATVNQTVHSFDFVAANERVTACDMAHVPLGNNSVDVAVFCLSLMGTNLHDYLKEANRVLKIGGVLKIAEVESRFDNVNTFIDGLKRFNFKNTWKDLSHNLFYFLDFKKEANIKNKRQLPTLSLHPCLYKKR